MTMTSVTVRVDDATKKQATDIVEDLGLDLSSVTRAVLPADRQGEPYPAQPVEATHSG